MRESLITEVDGSLQSQEANVVFYLASRSSYEESGMCSEFRLDCLRLEGNRLCVVLRIVLSCVRNTF